MLPALGLPEIIEESSPGEDSSHNDDWSVSASPEPDDVSGHEENEETSHEELAHLTAAIIRSDSSMSPLDMADEEQCEDNFCRSNYEEEKSVGMSAENTTHRKPDGRAPLRLSRTLPTKPFLQAKARSTPARCSRQ